MTRKSDTIFSEYAISSYSTIYIYFFLISLWSSLLIHIVTYCKSLTFVLTAHVLYLSDHICHYFLDSCLLGFNQVPAGFKISIDLPLRPSNSGPSQPPTNKKICHSIVKGLHVLVHLLPMQSNMLIFLFQEPVSSSNGPLAPGFSQIFKLDILEPSLLQLVLIVILARNIDSTNYFSECSHLCFGERVGRIFQAIIFYAERSRFLQTCEQLSKENFPWILRNMKEDQNGVKCIICRGVCE